MIILTRRHGGSVASVVKLAGRLDKPTTTGQHLYLVPSPDP